MEMEMTLSSSLIINFIAERPKVEKTSVMEVKKVFC